MIFDILDFLFLDKETKNLKEINKIWNELNYHLYHEYIDDLKSKLLKIYTIEHKEKVEFYLLLLDSLWKLHTQSTKK